MSVDIEERQVSVDIEIGQVGRAGQEGVVTEGFPDG